ncbi:hypothetical protein BKA62DRAFT_719183, partial [Auriculariales sp. MPI-PUGE-AT-0066]
MSNPISPVASHVATSASVCLQMLTAVIPVPVPVLCAMLGFGAAMLVHNEMDQCARSAAARRRRLVTPVVSLDDEEEAVDEEETLLGQEAAVDATSASENKSRGTVARRRRSDKPNPCVAARAGQAPTAAAGWTISCARPDVSCAVLPAASRGRIRRRRPRLTQLPSATSRHCRWRCRRVRAWVLVLRERTPLVQTRGRRRPSRDSLVQRHPISGLRSSTCDSNSTRSWCGNDPSCPLITLFHHLLPPRLSQSRSRALLN